MNKDIKKYAEHVMNIVNTVMLHFLKPVTVENAIPYT